MAGPLAQRIRKKYPGEYDDLSDEELEKKVLSKYPEYADLVEPAEEKIEPLTGVSFNKTADAPVIPPAPVVQEQSKEESGFLKQVWDAANKPLIDVQEVENEHPHARTTRLASQMLTPLNIGSAALTGGSSALAGALPQIARALGMGAKGLSAPVAAHGGYEVATGDTLADKGVGMLELIGGMLGMKQKLPGKSVIPEKVAPPKVQSPWDEIPNIDNKPPNPKNLITDGADVIDEATGEVIDMALPDKPSVNPLTKEPIDPIKHKPAVKMVSEKEVILNNPSVETVQQMNDGNYYTKKVNEDGSLVMTKRAPKSEKATETPSLAREIYNLPRGMMSVDLPFATSAAFRQAKPFIGTGNWFKAWKTAAGSFQSEEAFQNVMTRINSKPLFKKQLINGKIGPSVAEEMGLDMTDLRGINGREEALRSSLAEKIPLYGKYIRASNRAYTGFLNDLRANTLEDLFDSAKAIGRDPISKDKVLGQQIAEFINTATGRGKLGVEIGSRQINLEKNAKLMADVFFAPKLMASNIRMLNPSTYVTADPFVRKQYMLGMLRTMGTWGTIASLAKIAGADVSVDPRSSDFGKIKIGDTRIDLGGGMQQYLVLAAREASGQIASSTNIDSRGNSKVTDMGKGFKAPTRMSTAVDFTANKLHPTAKFAWDLLNASEYKQVGVGDRITEMALPMYVGDLKEILEEHPELAPLILGLTSVGIGSQTYEGGPPKPTLIPREYDYVIKGQPWSR